ncbi:hypothetical protein CBOM_06354 [Ceraceosorus bombacis]|uniref:Uncharacterized protein n=1 Tax=Ceraceosorus bombacis TaxID=401625 RepID=A0A0P1BQP8_9BASI|nr:hypothetical protein CBOM_06354 [Ceraceosorus bombacis]
MVEKKLRDKDGRRRILFKRLDKARNWLNAVLAKSPVQDLEAAGWSTVRGSHLICGIQAFEVELFRLQWDAWLHSQTSSLAPMTTAWQAFAATKNAKRPAMEDDRMTAISWATKALKEEVKGLTTVPPVLHWGLIHTKQLKQDIIGPLLWRSLNAATELTAGVMEKVWMGFRAVGNDKWLEIARSVVQGAALTSQPASNLFDRGVTVAKQCALSVQVILVDASCSVYTLGVDKEPKYCLGVDKEGVPLVPSSKAWAKQTFCIPQERLRVVEGVKPKVSEVEYKLDASIRAHTEWKSNKLNIAPLKPLEDVVSQGQEPQLALILNANLVKTHEATKDVELKDQQNQQEVQDEIILDYLEGLTAGILPGLHKEHRTVTREAGLPSVGYRGHVMQGTAATGYISGHHTDPHDPVFTVGLDMTDRDSWDKMPPGGYDFGIGQLGIIMPNGPGVFMIPQ